MITNGLRRASTMPLHNYDKYTNFGNFSSTPRQLPDSPTLGNVLTKAQPATLAVCVGVWCGGFHVVIRVGGGG